MMRIFGVFLIVAISVGFKRRGNILMQPLPPSPEAVQNLETHLNLIINLREQEKDEDFCSLMNKAKDVLGERHRKMARFYYQYGLYLLARIERNADVFGKMKAGEGESEQELKAAIPEDVEGEDIQAENQEEQGKEGLVVADPNQPEITADRKENLEEIVEEDEEQLCYENLEVALSILLTELERHNNAETIITQEELAKLEEEIIMVRLAIGDFYILKEQVVNAIKEYQDALDLRSKLPGKLSDRLFSSIHYLIGTAYSYEDNNQEKSIKYFVSSINILINHLSQLTSVTTYQRPTKENLKVNKLDFLPLVSDSSEVKDVKEFILSLLDKLEDLELEISQRQILQQFKEEERRRASSDPQRLGFDAPTTSNKTINLGTFGTSTTKVPGQPMIRITTPAHSSVTLSSPSKEQALKQPTTPKESSPDFQAQRLPPSNSEAPPQESSTKEPPPNESPKKESPPEEDPK